MRMEKYSACGTEKRCAKTYVFTWYQDVCCHLKKSDTRTELTTNLREQCMLQHRFSYLWRVGRRL